MDEIIRLFISLIFGGLLGYSFKFFLQKINEKETRAFERKEQRYKEILNSLLKLYRENDKPKLEIKKDLLFAYDFSWLYASDDVIKALDKLFIELSFKEFNKKKAMQLLAKVVILMRKDLGNKNTKLTINDWHPRNPE